MRAVLLWSAVLLSIAMPAPPSSAAEQRRSIPLEDLARSPLEAEFHIRRYTMRGTDLARECTGIKPEQWCHAAVEAVMAQQVIVSHQVEAARMYCPPTSEHSNWPLGRAALLHWLPRQKPEDLRQMPVGVAILAALRAAYPCPTL